MSRIGKLPIKIPSKVTVSIDQGEVTVKGPKGELRRHFHPDMIIKVENNTLTVARPSDEKLHRSLHGLTRTLLANMVEGADKGFTKELEVTGVGYRAEKAGDKVIIRAGYVHPIEVSPLPGISFEVEGANRIRVKGIDKEIVGQMAAKIRSMHPPDNYKGKGIRYAGEKVRLKAGKAGKAIGKKA